MSARCRTCFHPFDIRESDLNFYRKISVPAPANCPRCRMQRRLSYRNDRSLYYGQCALSGARILSMYDPLKKFTVYDYRRWWSEDWDPFSYGRNYDPNRPFLEQFFELQRAVPRFNLFNRESENCDYVNYAPHCKNCYLLFGSWFNQDCCYGQTLNECRDCFDCLFLDRGELCYQCVDCSNCYESAYCQNTRNAQNCWFCFDCQGTTNCIGCYNLRNKEYHIEQRPVSSEEFAAFKARLSSAAALNAYRMRFLAARKKSAVHQAVNGFQNENVSGDFIFQCRNAYYSFSAYRSEDIAYCGRVFEQKDSFDFDGGGRGELCYESMSNDFAYFSIGCTTCENLKFSHYCDICFNCTDCLGCVGVRRGANVILNKQYSKAQYEMLAARIVQQMRERGEWGEFFPVECSPFAYNETMAQEYFPLEQGQAQSRGWDWKVRESDGVEQRYAVPDNINDVADDVLNQVLSCEQCRRNFKIIALELSFCRKLCLPLPRKCPECRHSERMALRNPRRLWTRLCEACRTTLASAYDPKNNERVYCDACYHRLML